jgi:hypothetical protein
MKKLKKSKNAQPKNQTKSKNKKLFINYLYQKKRILSDIKQFYENLNDVQITSENYYIIDLAKKYCEDSKYWLEKNDLITSFGCINYAHGLLDSFRLKKLKS